MDWEQTSFQPNFSNSLFWGYWRTPPQQHDWIAIRKAIAACDYELSVLDGVLEGRRFVAGDELTLADVPIGTCMFRYYGLDLPRRPLPNVERWCAELQVRPAYREHVMLPFDDLKGRLAF
jgi:glutathione S-transferase